MYNRIILFSILFLTLALSSCKKTDVIYVSDPDDAFPMDLFTDYLPYKVNDTIYFNRYVINQDNLILYQAQCPFVVKDVVKVYNEGEMTSYKNEYAELNVQMLSTADIILDSMTISLNLSCRSRTRLNAHFELRQYLAGTDEALTTNGEKKFVNASDLIFKDFPADSIFLSDKAILKNGAGLVYFQDLLSGHQWYVNDK